MKHSTWNLFPFRPTLIPAPGLQSPAIPVTKNRNQNLYLAAVPPAVASQTYRRMKHTAWKFRSRAHPHQYLFSLPRRHMVRHNVEKLPEVRLTQLHAEAAHAPSAPLEFFIHSLDAETTSYPCGLPGAAWQIRRAVHAVGDPKRAQVVRQSAPHHRM